MSSETHRATVTIENRLGLHARPAMALVDLTNKFQSEVTIQRDDNPEKIDGKSIMQVMMLAATRGTKLLIETAGPDAGESLAAITALIARGFDE